MDWRRIWNGPRWAALVLAIALAATAAVHAAATQQVQREAVADSAPPPAALPHIELEPVAEAWRVRYTLPRPATELRFARTDERGHRARDWRPVDPQLQLLLIDGEEVVRRRDGAGFTTAAFDAPPRYVSLEKDYAPFSPFGDGGLLIHSGRFHACAGSCDGVDSPRWSFTVTPPADGHLLHDGRVVRGELRFLDSGSGTNLYAGKATPVETSHVLAVVDAAFPAAVQTQLTELFPRLMDFYAAELGALASKPMLFASSDVAHAGGGYGHQGGTLPGQVFMHLYGRSPDGDAESLAASMNWFFAHEAAHLFQRYDLAADPAQSWIHEGGAEALAAVALTRFGLLDARALQARVEQARAECADALAARVLNASASAAAFRSYYSCGLLMHLAVDAAARAVSGDTCGLTCVWRGFLARVDSGARWEQETFLAAVDAHAGAETAAFLRSLATEPLADPQATLSAGLAAAGVVGEPAEDAPH